MKFKYSEEAIKLMRELVKIEHTRDMDYNAFTKKTDALGELLEKEVLENKELLRNNPYFLMTYASYVSFFDYALCTHIEAESKKTTFEKALTTGLFDEDRAEFEAPFIKAVGKFSRACQEVLKEEK